MAAPKGNKNAARAATVRDSLLWALDHYEDSAIRRGQALRAICMDWVRMCLKDNLQAKQELASRLDGKPGQSLEIRGEISFLDVLAQYAAARVAERNQSDAVVQRSTDKDSEVKPVTH